ncbi:MAG: GAF domain-containing protein [Fidelibacterota bacterium]
MEIPPSPTDKERRYREVARWLKSLLFTDPDNLGLDEVGRMAIVCTGIKRAFPEHVFVGFYRVVQPGVLQVGPYQGDVFACGTIPFSRGVCGACARSGKTVNVPDVSRFPGYIACDRETQSEIAVPVKKGNQVIAVLDIDSARPAAFDRTDQTFLESIAQEFL